MGEPLIPPIDGLRKTPAEKTSEIAAFLGYRCSFGSGQSVPLTLKRRNPAKHVGEGALALVRWPDLLMRTHHWVVLLTRPVAGVRTGERHTAALATKARSNTKEIYAPLDSQGALTAALQARFGKYPLLTSCVRNPARYSEPAATISLRTAAVVPTLAPVAFATCRTERPFSRAARIALRS